MNTLITSLALGSIYCLISVALVVHFKISSFLNISILGYVVLAPYFVSEITSKQTSTLFFVLACLLCMLLISGLCFAVDTVLFVPISRLSAAMKVLVSVSILFIILTVVNVAWPSSIKLETPVGVSSVSIISTQISWIDLIAIVTALLLIAGSFLLVSKTLFGKRLMAFSLDRSTAVAYGISPLYVRIVVSVFTGVFATLAGIFLAIPVTPTQSATSLFVYSLAAIAPVIVARHSYLRVCLGASFVIAFMQTVAIANLDTLNRYVQNLISLFTKSTEVSLGLTFAESFVPFAIVILSLLVIPPKWMRGGTNE